MKFKKSFYSIVVDGPLKPDGSADKIAYSTRSGGAITISSAHADAISQNDFAGLPKDLLNSLLGGKFIVPEFEDEFETCLAENKAFLDDGQGLSYTIQPTGNCQLGCGYCGQLHRNVTMTKEVMDQIFERIQSISQTKPFKRLDITWYGGEPLIATDNVLYLSELLIAYCQERGLQYGADMITNGFLLSGPKLEKLVKDAQVRVYQITLDGLPEYHDKSRPTKSNRPSFDKIFGNIKAFVNSALFEEYSCVVAIRMNINRANFDSIPQFIDFLADEGLGGRVKLDFCPIVDWGNNNASANSLSIQEFAEKEIEWMVHGITRGFKFDVLVPKRRYGVCMVIDKQSEVYDAYGNIYPCYELPYTPGYEDGANLIGNVKEPELAKAVSDVPLRNWNETVREKQFGCNKCTYFPVCGGGCPKSWLAGNVPCPSFKFNMDQRLLIQSIRQGIPTQTV